MYGYGDDRHCFGCGYSWESNSYLTDDEENICPSCGIDTRNPIQIYYNRGRGEEIKQKIKDLDWLKNVNIDYFLKEKKIREKDLKKTTEMCINEQHTLEIWSRNEDEYHEIWQYCLEHYSIDDGSFIDLTYVDVRREMYLNFPYYRDLSHLARVPLFLALKAIAQRQLDELYAAMEDRKDKGIKEKTDGMLEHETVKPQETKQETGVQDPDEYYK